MASSENLTSLDPWSFSFNTPTTLLTETTSLQKSLFNFNYFDNNSSTFFSDNYCFINDTITDVTANLAPPTPTGSTVTGSDPETGLLKRKTLSGPKGKVAKRKPRAGKRSQTTFIAADAANFREMVQRVTGAQFGKSVAPVVKPEAQIVDGGSLVGSGYGGGCLLPTLDTSAFLLNSQCQQEVAVAGPAPSKTVGLPPGLVADRVAAAGGGFDFGSFSGFPTLESWTVV